MEKLESVGTTPSNIAVSDRADAHRSSNDNPKSGRRARHGVSTTGCPSVVDPFPYTLDLGSNPIRLVSLQISAFQIDSRPFVQVNPASLSSGHSKTADAVSLARVLDSLQDSKGCEGDPLARLPRPLQGERPHCLQPD